MRKIRFRGKATMSIEELNEIGIKHDSGWVYGSLIIDNNMAFIVGRVIEWDEEYLAHEWWVMVDIGTVGQYTEFKDKNDKEIYDGHTLTRDGFWSIRIEYEDGCFWVRDLDPVRYANRILNRPVPEFNFANWEITGNIYENPELSK
ncbi:MAG TPA: YopX family protein [Tissierellaceae bacterium]|nr:YopX family protein [Tissierellaceae bacterium]